MLFREHRGSLDKSMRTVVEVNTEKDLIRHIEKTMSFMSLTWDRDKPIGNLKFKYQGYDERIKWNAWLVTLEGYGIVGMMNGNFNDKDEDFRKGIEALNPILTQGMDAFTDEARAKFSKEVNENFEPFPRCTRPHLGDFTKAELEYQLLVNNLAPPALYSDRTARAELRYFMLFVLVVFAGVMLFS